MIKDSQESCAHEFGTLGTESKSYCIHCGAKLSDLEGIVGVLMPCIRCGALVLTLLDTPPNMVACQEHCPFDTQDACWDDQEQRADADFICPVHGQAKDTLGRLGVDVL